MQTEEKNKTGARALIGTGLIAVLFLGSSTFFYLDNGQLKHENNVKTEQISTLSSAKQKLEFDLHQIDAELSQYKGKNQELDKLLNSSYKELKEKKIRIQKLLKQNASLAKYKKEAESLRKFEKNYKNKIASLEQRIGSLSSENSTLKNDNLRLKASLEELENNYMILERKVAIASILKVDKVIASAEKKTRKGSYTKVHASKKADRILLNFELSENRVADAGEKNIYIRILDPSGNVLPAPTSEKGYFSNSSDNIELPYSVSKVVNYSNNEIKTEASYAVGQQELKPGTYTIEFYCEGNFSGASKYKLK